MGPQPVPGSGRNQLGISTGRGDFGAGTWGQSRVSPRESCGVILLGRTMGQESLQAPVCLPCSSFHISGGGRGAPGSTAHQGSAGRRVIPRCTFIPG